jgi:phosphoribosyl-ATP pyrophosphohydrolase
MAVTASLAPSSTILDRVYARIEGSRDGDPTKSYTAKLFQRGRAKIAQKLGEEAVEAVIELLREDKPALIGESADLLYHLLAAWVAAGIRPEEVWAELGKREGIGGLVEKASRKGS